MVWTNRIGARCADLIFLGFLRCMRARKCLNHPVLTRRPHPVGRYFSGQRQDFLIDVVMRLRFIVVKFTRILRTLRKNQSLSTTFTCDPTGSEKKARGVSRIYHTRMNSQPPFASG